MAGPRNPAGVNNSIDCYRTIGGIRYHGNPDMDDTTVAAYRKAGVRCRRSDGTLFVHPDDEELMCQVEDRLQAARTPEPAPSSDGKDA